MRRIFRYLPLFRISIGFVGLTVSLLFAALALGLIPEPIGLPTAALDLVFGFAFVSLTIWGIGGLLRIRPHHEKHA